MIKINNLTKKFSNFTAVNNLCLDIPKGQLFGFIGPNGAGKTTTIKLLCGLLHPTGGEITINGLSIQNNMHKIRQIIGYIPDSPFVYPRLTPAEFFEFTADLYSIPSKTAKNEKEYYFSLFGLNDYENILIKDLSHGLRQRMVYTAAFLHKPTVLFIDEPFVGLDPYSIRLIRKLLKEKAKQGMTIFLTTHILALAENMAEKIGIISKGKLIANGTINELKQNASDKDALEDIFLKLTKADL
jgi:ABC-2 type transport system ATP-binding protein